MANIVGELQGMTGIGMGNASSGGNFPWIILVLILFFAIAGGFITYYILMKKKYKYKVVVFEKVNGSPEPTRKDKAKIFKLGSGGDEIIFLKKNKKFLPKPVNQVGKNTYWIYVSEDGEWLEFSPGDFEKDRREMGAFFLDKEMRFARTSLQNQRKERYEQLNWWQKNGTVVAGIAILLVVGIVMFLILKQFSEVASSLTNAIDASKDVLSETKNIIGYLDDLNNGGLGYN